MKVFNPMRKIYKSDAKKETAAKIINLLDGFNYRDSKIILGFANDAIDFYSTVNAPNPEGADYKPAQ